MLNAKKVAASLRTSQLVGALDADLVDACEEVLHFWIDREEAALAQEPPEEGSDSVLLASHCNLLAFLNFGTITIKVVRISFLTGECSCNAGGVPRGVSSHQLPPSNTTGLRRCCCWRAYGGTDRPGNS